MNSVPNDAVIEEKKIVRKAISIKDGKRMHLEVLASKEHMLKLYTWCRAGTLLRTVLFHFSVTLHQMAGCMFSAPKCKIAA